MHPDLRRQEVRQERRREELWKALDYLREGDTLIVPSLDRLGRSIQDLIAIVSGLRKRGVGFTSLHEALDTTTPGGRLVFHVLAALAESIRELIVPGTNEGLDAARARGARLGRPPAMTEEQVRHARDLLVRPENTVTSIAKLLGGSAVRAGSVSASGLAARGVRTRRQGGPGGLPVSPSATGTCAAVRDRHRPLLLGSTMDLLATHDEARLAQQLRDELIEKHPDRSPTPQVVRNALESLVAKGRIRRHKQQRSVRYTLAQPHST